MVQPVTAPVTAPSAPDEVLQASMAVDPLSCARLFWETLTTQRGGVEAARIAAHRFVPPPVNAFFDESAGEAGEGESKAEESGVFVEDAGASVMSVEVGTPVSIVKWWNSDREVPLVQLKEDWCLAKVERSGGDVDYRACIKSKSGEERCDRTTHIDAPGMQPAKRMEIGAEGTFAIMVPMSSSVVKQPSVFSAPTFELSDFPASLLEMGRHEILLELELEPKTWRFLLGNYPGKAVMLEWHQEAMGRGAEENIPSTPAPPSDDIDQAPGMNSILRDFQAVASSARRLGVQEAERRVRMTPAAGSGAWEGGGGGGAPRSDPPPSSFGGTSQSRYGTPSSSVGMASARGRGGGGDPPPPFPWETTSAGSGNGSDEEDGGSVLSTITETAALRGLTTHVNQLTKKLQAMEADRKTMLVSLGATINNQKESIRDLKQQVRNLQPPPSAAFFGRGASASGTPPSLSTLSSDDREALIREVMASLNISAYQKASAMKNYVTHGELKLLDYVDATRLGAAIPSSASLPPRLGDRLDNVEHELKDPSGSVAALRAAVKSLEDRKLGKSVTFGGYVFRDQESVEAWARTLNDPEAFRFCVDFKAQLAGCTDEYFTMAEGIANEASALKAGYNSVKAARMAMTFGQTYPETIIRKSTAAKDAVHGGYVFQGTFSTNDIFDGDIEHSTKEDMKRRLGKDRDRHQTAIDGAFPPDQTAHTRTNTIFSQVLRKGYRDAITFLDSLPAFYKMMSQSGLSANDAMGKELTYVKTVFEKIQEVRTTSSERGSGAKIYGMMRATLLVEAFSQGGWYKHADVSYSLVMSALQREGSLASEVKSAFAKEIALIKANAKAVEAVEKELTNLKNKNPSWKK